MKKVALIAGILVVTLLGFAGGVALAVYTGRAGEAAFAAPGGESRNSGQSAPRSAPSASTPGPASDAPAGPLLARARRLFNADCASCHRASGAGAALHKKDRIPDFTDAAWQARRSDADLIASVQGGRGAVMPAFGGRLSDDEIAHLVAYIRTLPAPAAARAAGEASRPDASHPAPGGTGAPRAHEH